MTQLSAQQQELARTWAQRMARLVTRFMGWFSQHWLLMINMALGLYAGLPLLAPYLLASGHSLGGRVIYLLFYPLCHQLPERSFFLFGRQWFYSVQELSAQLGGIVPPRYVGNAVLGYKMAVCQRCFALWGSAFLAGLLFNLVRHRLWPLSLRAFGLFIMPMAIDGMGQLLGLWQSSWISRLVTGSLFGVGGIWLLYPHVEAGMKRVQQQCSETLAEWEEGR